ncbi:hypothetical protein DGWBC_0571 [Dehalogenimonas sp. WBC-2]|nr:hypothetical protein DGWBC_0571 [Dehalogenimonas sp. WBC-2]
MSSVVFGFIEVIYGKQPVVLAAFNRKKEVVSVIFTFGGTTSTLAPEAGYWKVLSYE